MDYKVLILFLIGCFGFSQTTVEGVVTDEETQIPLHKVQILSGDEVLAETDEKGKYQIDLEKEIAELSFFKEDYQIADVFIGELKEINVELSSVVSLSTIEVQAHKKREFAIRRMQDVEGTSILAGKKNEVVLLEQLTANLATNNARQVYGQVVGLNIFEYNDGGLQLGIGGRGLDPNRTANFNTRQNGYDISADVLGYPESYYTPATEALEEIQIIRGAASLQYGTQFGGLINFKFKQPNPNKKFEFITRNTLGSNNLFTTFNSASGTVGKLGYYAFVNYKRGDSFRPNSGFNSLNYYAHVDYQLSPKTKITGEFTHFDYLAQQAGGLTDVQFEEDITFSNRERNWFQVDWNLFDFNIEHDFTENSKVSTHIFGLQSQRDALGFRSNRISQVDEPNEPRDLLKGEFNNWGIESRYLQNYQLLNQENTFLIGVKYYNANNKGKQGPGTRASNDNFNYDYESTPNYPYQSDMKLPNRNVAVFGENIFKLSDKFSITPGFRYEWISTKAIGQAKQLTVDLAGNILSENILDINKEINRDLWLFGIGLSYKMANIELYSNISENYRSVTFSDIYTVSPSRFVSEDIKDESGYSFDLGLRGNFKKYVSYDANLFSLYYNDKLGEYYKVIDNQLKRGKDNIGTAWIYGLEFFADFDLDRIFNLSTNNFAINYFINTALTQSEYIEQTVETADVIKGNKVKFVPAINLKTGLGFGYKNLTSQLQLTYVSKQYTDATNAEQSSDPINGGIIGAIPSYMIMDFSAGYSYKRYKLEASINNLLDNKYFVRRADGYPGPGIIPSAPLNWSVTLQVKL